MRKSDFLRKIVSMRKVHTIVLEYFQTFGYDDE